MKKLATAIAAIALIGTPAFAADMAVKAPPPAPPPVYSWTGWYAGVNVGASFGRAKTDFNAAPITLTSAAVPQNITGPIPGFAGSDTVYPSGFMGGGQIGYNWQFSPIWVAGVEADFQGAVEKDGSTITNPFFFPSVPVTFGGIPVSPAEVTGTAVTNYTTKIEWFGTVRLRAGYVWGDGNVFSYVTGGFAYGKVDLEGTSTVSGVAAAFVPFSVTQAFGHNAVNTGWVAGYGTEGKLLIPGWTYKIEGLYMDLGTLDTTGVTTGASAGSIETGPFFATGGQVTTHTHFTDTILRAGLNYQFH